MKTELEINVDKHIKLEKPKKYKVIMYNDDYTPMVFVIYVLIDVFNKSEQAARKLTLDIHNSSCKTVGIYSYDIAMTKKIQTDNISRRNGYPLKITIEEAKQNES